MAVNFIGGWNVLPRENRHLPQVTDKSNNIMLHRVHLNMCDIQLTILAVIGTDYTSSFKPNYHTYDHDHERVCKEGFPNKHVMATIMSP